MRCKTAATRRRRANGALVAFAFGVTATSRASAEPIRLRAEAVAETRAPVGLVVLEGQDKLSPWINAEALVWAGARTDPTADVLVLAVRMREPHGLGDLRVGRFVLTTGAVRPVQLDGAAALARAPWGSTFEVFGGAPVVPRFASFAYDWLAGGRVAQTIVSRATVGVSYVQRRSHGEIADSEVGADFAAVPVKWLDVAARAAYDVTSPGIADAIASAAARSGPWRFELFGSHRSPSRLLPATSLFSVLGDFPSQMVGGTVRWQAAPRLDFLATGAGQTVGGEYGGNGWLRALLRLDDRGDGSLGLELRRQDVSSAKWSGVRMIGSQALPRSFRFSSEIELAFPDEPRGRGTAWPWGLLALSWRSKSGWEAAGAIEAAATPEHRFETNALVRVSRTLEVR